jgi:hypothetical protein
MRGQRNVECREYSTVQCSAVQSAGDGAEQNNTSQSEVQNHKPYLHTPPTKT